MGDPRGAKAPAGIAQSIIGARKPPYHDKVMDHMEEMPYMTYHTRQAIFIEYLDNLNSNAKTMCRNGFIDDFSLRIDTEHTHLCKITFYFFYR